MVSSRLTTHDFIFRKGKRRGRESGSRDSESNELGPLLFSRTSMVRLLLHKSIMQHNPIARVSIGILPRRSENDQPLHWNLTFIAVQKSKLNLLVQRPKFLELQNQTWDSPFIPKLKARPTRKCSTTGETRRLERASICAEDDERTSRTHCATVLQSPYFYCRIRPLRIWFYHLLR